MSELPPDLPRLLVIRDWLEQARARQAVVDTYLQLQQERVDAAIAAATPQKDVGYRLQHLRSSRPRAVLHRADCWVAGGTAINREDALLALTDEQVAPNLECCDACRPTPKGEGGEMRATLWRGHRHE